MKISKLHILYIVIVLSSAVIFLLTKDYKNRHDIFKLQVIGRWKRKPSIGDFLQLIITYKTEKDSVFSTVIQTTISEW